MGSVSLMKRGPGMACALNSARPILGESSVTAAQHIGRPSAFVRHCPAGQTAEQAASGTSTAPLPKSAAQTAAKVSRCANRALSTCGRHIARTAAECKAIRASRRPRRAFPDDGRRARGGTKWRLVIDIFSLISSAWRNAPQAKISAWGNLQRTQNWPARAALSRVRFLGRTGPAACHAKQPRHRSSRFTGSAQAAPSIPAVKPAGDACGGCQPTGTLDPNLASRCGHKSATPQYPGERLQLGTNTLASVGLANPGPTAAVRAAASRFIGSVWHGAGPGSTRLTPGPATARLPVAQLTVPQLPAARLRDEGRPAPRPKAAHQSRVATQPST